MTNPFENRDLTKLLLFPTLSWSSYNAFVNYDKGKWYEAYVLGKRGPINSAMQAGIDIGERLTVDEVFLPEIPRGGIFEQELHAKLGDIDLIGHMDHYWPLVGIDEYKTSTNPLRWDQDAVDNWGQITFYCLLVWLNHKVDPAKLRLRLFAILLKETGSFKLEPIGSVDKFETYRKMSDILKFSVELKKTHREMINYVNKRNENTSGINS